MSEDSIYQQLRASLAYLRLAAAAEAAQVSSTTPKSTSSVTRPSWPACSRSKWPPTTKQHAGPGSSASVDCPHPGR